MDVLQVIQMLVAPVVMISACGLLCLAFYNRLSVMVSRIRTFNQERLAILEKINGPALENQRDGLRQRLSAVDVQVQAILARARLVRNTLFGLVTCIICMILTSLCQGMALVAEQMTRVALGVFVLGLLILLGAMVVALVELHCSLQPVALDRDFLLQLDHHAEPDEHHQV